MLPLALALGAATRAWVTTAQANFGAASAAIAAAFSGTQQKTDANGKNIDDPHATLGYYWHWPALADDHRGLGGGVAYALDEASLCGALLDAVVERDGHGVGPAVGCADVRAAFHRAFQTWAAAHPALRFRDVTHECARAHGATRSNCSLVELWVTTAATGGADDAALASAHARPWPYGTAAEGSAPYPGAALGVAGFSDCSAIGHIPKPTGVAGIPTECDSAASVWYATRDDAVGVKKLADIAQDVDNMNGRRLAEAAAARPSASATYVRYADDLRSTNGMVQRWDGGEGRRVIEAYGGVLALDPGECWYLDSGWCAPMHRLKAALGVEGARALVAGLAWAVFALTLLALAAVVAWRVWQRVEAEAEALLPALGRVLANGGARTGLVALVVALLWTPIALQVALIQPCWECRDLEAAAITEVGRVLGLGFPDEVVPVTNTATGAPFPTGANGHHIGTASNAGARPYDTPGLPLDGCLHPWANVSDGVWPGASDVQADTGVRASVMARGSARHRPRTCLSSDDIEGLYVLYPVCDGTATPTMAPDAGADADEGGCGGKARLRLGALRFWGWLLFPAAVAVGIVLAVGALARLDVWRGVVDFEPVVG